MKIHHVGYLVKNIGKAEADFARLGFERKTPVVYDPLRDVDISFWENDGYCVELVSPKTEASVVYGLMKKYKNMPYHICHCSENLEEDIERLTASGFAQIDEPAEAVAIGGRKVCFLMSAHSGMIELLENEG